MPTQSENTFTTWKLTKDEILQGTMLSRLHKLVVQNQIAALAESKLSLKFTPNNLNDYTQQEAYLAGKIDILQALLLNSDDSEKQYASEVVASNEQADLDEANENHACFLTPAVDGSIK